MELIKNYDIRVLCNPGVESAQLLTPDNSRSGKVSVTKVSVMPGAEQPRHKHYTSEQVWVAIQGRGVLLLADDKEVPFEAGDVVRFSEKEIHGLKNIGPEIFEYISISTPPINFGYAYMHER
jgi:mannose-6-phosphate isomerase-like protein (cupin superfamily)